MNNAPTAIHIPASLIHSLQKSKHVVIFTGAGVSQESGIPTFRDAQTGLWQQYDPEELATPSAFAKNRDLVWGWYEYRRRMVMLCQPNPAHTAIAAMEKIFPKLTLITQNVDDLHERAGSTSVVHLHGSLFRPRCRGCGRPHSFSAELPDLSADQWRTMPPKCTHCGGWIRPGVVWFGEDLPQEAWFAAMKAVKSADVFISIGTSALVYPAASLPELAVQKKLCVIQINPDVTSLNLKATYRITSKAGEALPAIYGQLISDS